jgi:hypothetical protein
MRLPPNVRRRGDQFFARRAVPAKLRPIIGKTELTREIGTTHAEMLRRHYSAGAELDALLQDAQRQLDGLPTPQPVTSPKRTTDLRTIARIQYDAGLGRDDNERAAGTLPDWSRDRARAHYMVKLQQLRDGKLSDEEAGALIGWAADDVIASSAAPKVSRSDLLRTLAGVQLGALAAFTARDRNEPEPEPVVPVSHVMDGVNGVRRLIRAPGSTSRFLVAP